MKWLNQIVMGSLLIIFITSSTLYVNTGQSLVYDSNNQEVHSVKFTVLIDNYPNGTLNTPWGLSILIKTSNLTILFDTGPDPTALRENAEALGIQLNQLDCVVISHGHQDHIHAISYVVEQNPNITVFVPRSMNSFCKEMVTNLTSNMVEIGPTYSIDNGINIIGGLYAPLHEQALAINVQGLGLIIFVGCSHPGVDNILKRAINDLGVKPFAVIGGFHTLEEEIEYIELLIEKLLETNITKICPTHCSGDLIRNYMQTNHFTHYKEVKVGYSTTFQGIIINSSTSLLETTTSRLITTNEEASSPNFEFYYGFLALFFFLALRMKKGRTK
ncbi:MAG: MBL fold metallo-hydrolase [Candidatus Hodarchaeota archaeon]